MENFKWVKFDQTKGSKQKRPPLKKYVMVICESLEEGSPNSVVLGYRKDAAGNKQSPYFVTPGVNRGAVLAWCDCLPDGFEYPLEYRKRLFSNP